jgi:cytidylate kinase
MWNTAVASLGSDDYRPFIERVVNELADQKHALIVGHASQYVLRGRPEVLKVLILGSEGARTLRLVREQNIDEKQALTEVRTSDKDRSDLLRKVYKFDWLDASHYDLTINTDNVSTEVAIDAIIAAAKSLTPA